MDERPSRNLAVGPECTGTSVTLWTGDIRYKSLAAAGGLKLGIRAGLLPLLLNTYSRRRGRGNVVIPKGFPKSVVRVESRLYGFPCFPYSVISMACLRGGIRM